MWINLPAITRKVLTSIIGGLIGFYSIGSSAGYSPTAVRDVYGEEEVSSLTGDHTGNQILFRGAMIGLRGRYQTESAIVLDYLARIGDGSSQYVLGTMFQHGVGVQRSSMLASVWFQEAAESGIAASQFNVGLAQLRVGNPSRAAYWWERAARQAHLGAAYNLGILCLYGLGVDANHARAANLIMKAAAGGFVDAQFYLALMYLNGHGIERDKAVGEKWLKRSIASGYVLGEKDIAHLGSIALLPTVSVESQNE